MAAKAKIRKGYIWESKNSGKIILAGGNLPLWWMYYNKYHYCFFFLFRVTFSWRPSQVHLYCNFVVDDLQPSIELMS